MPAMASASTAACSASRVSFLWSQRETRVAHASNHSHSGDGPQLTFGTEEIDHELDTCSAFAVRLAFAGQADHQAEFGAPSLTIRRGRLAEILLARARTAGVDLRFNVQVTGVAALPPGRASDRS